MNDRSPCVVHSTCGVGSGLAVNGLGTASTNTVCVACDAAASPSLPRGTCTDAPSDWSSCGRGGQGSSGGVGKSCKTYEDSNWCVPVGGRVDPVGGGGNYGTSWNFATMKTFEDYAGPCPDRSGGDKAGGMGANQACCACGGGAWDVSFNIHRLLPPPSPTC